MNGSAGGVAAVVPVHRLAVAGGESLGVRFGGTTVLGHTLGRLARCEAVGRIIVLHRRGEALPVLGERAEELGGRLMVHAVESLDGDGRRAARLAARKWSPTAWRGGLGGATCYDEVLCAGAMDEALERAGASAGLIVGPDWVLVDPGLCDAVARRHLDQPEVLKLVFTQAPPGLAGCVVARPLLGELAEKGATIGALLDYQPRVPQGDPIGKDPCVRIDPAVRDAPVRAVLDAPRWARVLRSVERSVGAEELLRMDAGSVVEAMADAAGVVHDPLPQQVTIEVNTERAVPARRDSAPQHHEACEREPMTLDVARRLFEQLAAEPDTVVTLGGLGDPLLHAEWEGIVEAAHEAGIHGVHIETDLLVEREVLGRLIDLPIDVVSVRLNADSAETYRELMGCDGFERVVKNIEWLLNNRSRPRNGAAGDGVGLPWVVPRMMKVRANVEELEKFFDRWAYYCGHVVVEPPPAPAPGDTMPDLSLMDMSPPRRFPCRQLRRRMTIHSDGRAALCDADRTGGHGPGNGEGRGVAELWRAMDGARALHEAGRYDEMPLCAGCRQWHRP